MVERLDSLAKRRARASASVPALGILERGASFLQLGTELLGERARDEAPKKIAHDEGPDSPRRLLEGHHAAKAKPGCNLLRHLCTSQALRRVVQELATLVLTI